MFVEIITETQYDVIWVVDFAHLDNQRRGIVTKKHYPMKLGETRTKVLLVG